MTKHNDQERAQFEAELCERHGYQPRTLRNMRDEDSYGGIALPLAWSAWQARAKLPTDVGAVPEGWKWVPVEPTPEMLFACEDAGSIQNHQRGKRIYRAMLTAAPHPVSGEQRQAPSVSIGVETLKWWRQLVELNPSDLAPRIDAAITRAAPPEAQDVSGLLDISRKILAKLQHPTASVNAMDMWKLEDALKPFEAHRAQAQGGDV